MASGYFSSCASASLPTRHLLLFSSSNKSKRAFRFSYAEQEVIGNGNGSSRIKTSSELRVSSGDSYLEMWKNAMDQERKEFEFQKIVDNSEKREGDGYGGEDDKDALERRSEQFMKILEVPKDERDRVQRMQVIDRAAAAIAAAQALINETPPPAKLVSDDSVSERSPLNEENGIGGIEGGKRQRELPVSLSRTSGRGTPGPDFWSWTPPLDDDTTSEDLSNLKMAGKPSSSPSPTNIVMEKEQSIEFLPIPFESTLLGSRNPPLPPLQSLTEVGNVDASNSKVEMPIVVDRHEVDLVSSVNAAEVVEALGKVDEALSHGVNPDGSKWWKETGVERRSDGVVCRWTLNRGVSADKSVEWEEKYWEAADNFDYKELGSEKSGRDAAGNVWREYWRESMWQDIGSGLINMEKTADKWGKNGQGGEWQEKWWEHYDASGQADKWAHKWCSIDPNTPLEAGHAHVWHERWGEKYDGQGGSVKYTDKWAERYEHDGWSKWGDKWDENFNQYGHGVKQGETWWKGKYGERWNRTWGERHNGSGWIHKYGKSSSGEHWDTHVQQDTWYERYPHFGFQHCLENSVQLREVCKPSET